MAPEQTEDYKKLKEARSGAPPSDDKKSKSASRGGRDDEDGKKAEKNAPKAALSMATIIAAASAVGILGGAAVGAWLGSQVPLAKPETEIVEEEEPPEEDEIQGPQIDLSQGLDLALTKPSVIGARGSDGRLVPSELGMTPLPAATAASRETVLEPEERRELTRPLRPRTLVDASLGSLCDTGSNPAALAGGLNRSEPLASPPVAPRRGLAPSPDLPAPGTPDLRDTGAAASDQPLSLDETVPPRAE